MIIIPGIYNAQTHIPGGNVQGQVITVGAILKVTERDRRPYPSDPGTPSEIWIDNTAAIGYVCKEVGPNGTVWDRLDVLGDYVAFGDNDPGVNADITWGYRPGSLRYARNSEILWICKDSTQGAAVWNVLSSGGSVVSVNGQTGVVQLYLDDLLDVDAPLPTNGDVLTWDSATSTWIALAPTGGGGTYTADNGITETANNFQLGGTLIQNTTINNTGFYTLFTGALSGGSSIGILRAENSGSSPAFRANNGGNGNAIRAISNSGIAAYIQSVSSTAGYFLGTIGRGIYSESSGSYGGTFTRKDVSQTGVLGVLEIFRGSNGGAGLNNIGGSIDFKLAASNGGSILNLASRLISVLTDVNILSLTSRFSINNINNLLDEEQFYILGSGQIGFNKYGQTPANFPGTPIWALGVDALGNVIEFTPGGGGSTYTVDNGLTPDPFNINNFQLGGNLIKSTIISTGLTTANNRLQIDAPQNTDTAGSLYVTALNPGGTYTSSNNILANFQSNDIITAFFRTGSSYGGSGTGVYIQSTNALCTPIVIYGSGALGSGEIFKVTDNGQLVLEEYNSSTSFQGVSGTSQGVLNVDNTGKVFVGSGGGGGIDGANSRRWGPINGSVAPNSGQLRLRTTGGVTTQDPSAVIDVRISRFDDTTADMQSWFTALDNYRTANPNKAYIQITDSSNNSVFGIYEIGNMTYTSIIQQYWTIGLTYVSGSVGLFTVGSTVTFSWVLFGADGTGGTGDSLSPFLLMGG